MASPTDGGVPTAEIVHRSCGRTRLRLREHRGDQALFDRINDFLGDFFPAHQWRTEPLTGSILLLCPSADVDRLREKAEAARLFGIAASDKFMTAASRQLTAPLGHLNRFLEKATSGLFDLPNLLFLLFVGFGLAELARGNFKTPPWYTAFWYAFGVFSRSVVDAKTSSF